MTTELHEVARDVKSIAFCLGLRFVEMTITETASLRFTASKYDHPFYSKLLLRDRFRRYFPSGRVSFEIDSTEDAVSIDISIEQETKR